jgi:hypothetical protein
MIIILTDFHLLLAESILRTGELLTCYFYQFENALLEGDISIEITQFYQFEECSARGGYQY